MNASALGDKAEGRKPLICNQQTSLNYADLAASSPLFGFNFQTAHIFKFCFMNKEDLVIPTMTVVRHQGGRTGLLVIIRRMTSYTAFS